MWSITVWKKLALIVVIALLPIPLLGYLSIGAAARYLSTEQKRLAGLQYIQGLRTLLEHVQQHRTAVAAIRTGDVGAQVKLPIIDDQIAEDVENQDAFDAQLGPLLQSSDAWLDLKDSW